MTWFKTDDGFWRCRKVRRLGADKVPAVGVWLLSGNWAADNLTDGFVPWEIVEGWDTRRRYAKRLLDVGLWEESEHDGESGVLFHDWTDYQPTAEQVQAERAASARRQALARDPTLREAVRTRDADRCRYCGKKVRWNDRRSTIGGTYDHVNPAGPNTIDNLVIACRGCNAAKGHRTPEQAGMPLRTPIQVVSSYEPDPNQVDPESALESDVGSEFELDSVSSPVPTRPDPTIKEDSLRSSSARKRPIPLPDDWQPTDVHRAFVLRHGLDLDREVFAFRAHADSNDRRQASWNGAFSTWLAKSADRPRPKAAGGEDWRRYSEQ